MNITKKHEEQPKIIKLDKFKQHLPSYYYRNRPVNIHQNENDFFTFKDESIQCNNPVSVNNEKEKNTSRTHNIPDETQKINCELCDYEKENNKQYCLVKSKSISYLDTSIIQKQPKVDLQNTNTNFYYKSNFYIEIPKGQNNKVVPCNNIENYSFRSGHLDGGKVNLYNFKFQYGEGKSKKIQKNTKNLYGWNDKNSFCKIDNYQYIGNDTSMNNTTIQKDLYITENSCFEIEPENTNINVKKRIPNLKSVIENQFLIESLKKNKLKLVKENDKGINGKILSEENGTTYQMENKMEMFEDKSIPNETEMPSVKSNGAHKDIICPEKKKKMFFPSFLKNDKSSFLTYNSLARFNHPIKKVKSENILKNGCKYKTKIKSYISSNEKSFIFKKNQLNIMKKNLGNYSSIILPPNDFYKENPCVISGHINCYPRNEKSNNLY